MIFEEMSNARQRELDAAAQTISHRIEWERVSRIERLETALRAARKRLPWHNPSISAKAS